MVGVGPYKIGIGCFSSKHATLRVKANTGWLKIRLMCQIGVMCLPVDLLQWASIKNPTNCISLVQSTPHCWYATCSRHDIVEKLLIWCWQSLHTRGKVTTIYYTPAPRRGRGVYWLTSVRPRYFSSHFSQ